MHVALVVDGNPVAGAVALPAHGLVYSTESPPHVPPAGPTVRLAVSRTGLPR